jgi:hypothetical protein
MTDEQPNKRGRVLARAVLVAAIAVLMAGIAMVMAPFKPPTAYGFITAGHPIDVMNDASGRWFFYQADPAKGAAPVLAAAVRKELLPLGFTEDLANQPWFRFVKGAREVIVCNHDEIMTNETSPTSAAVYHERVVRRKGEPAWPVLWVHEPGRDTAAVSAFKIKKLVFQW